MSFFFREKMVCEKCEKKGKLGKVNYLDHFVNFNLISSKATNFDGNDHVVVIVIAR